jgi:hypothetical protein
MKTGGRIINLQFEEQEKDGGDAGQWSLMAQQSLGLRFVIAEAKRKNIRARGTL